MSRLDVPDTRPRRLPASERREEYALEVLEEQFPTLRAYRDARGWCLEIDGVPIRARSAFVDDRDRQNWNSQATYYRGLDA